MKIKKFINKWKKQNTTLKIIFLIVLVWYLISLIFITKAITSLVGIETTLRVILLLILILHLFIFSIGGLVLLFTKKRGRLIFLIVLTCIYSPILDFASYHINKTYNILNKVQKKRIEYTSVMISLKDTKEFNKIGILSAKNDPTGYILPQDMIKKYSIDGEIKEYDEPISMLSDLYDKEVDAIFTSSNYVTMYNSYEKFANIASETKVIHEMSKKLDNADNVSYSTKKLTEPFTLLLMGVDSTGDGIASGSSFNGDSLMMITFNPKTLNATVFSIPRDTYVPIACNQNRENKINSSAYGGTSCVVKTIENLTKINIDYYVKINFTGVVKLVDDLGGIYVDIPIKFCEQDSQRRFGSYEICLDKGYQKLNGEQALAFSRHRHSLPLGDFQRVQHQQMVVEAMVQELKNINSTDEFYKILEDVANNIDTNMTTEQILSFYGVAKDVLINSLKNNSNLSIEKTYLTGYDLTMYIPAFRSYVYTFQYYKQSLNDIVNLMKVNLEIEKPKPIKTFSFDINEPYEKPVTGKTYYNEKKKELLPKFIGQSQSYVKDWAKERGIGVQVKEEKSNNPDGIVIAQSIQSGTLIENISNITITISINKNPNTGPIEDNPNNGDDPTNDAPTEPIEPTIPDFTGYTVDKFNRWKNSLKDANLIIETAKLSVDDLLTLDLESLENNKIYKQSIKPGTKLNSISTLKVYYYAEETIHD